MDYAEDRIKKLEQTLDSERMLMILELGSAAQVLRLAAEALEAAMFENKKPDSTLGCATVAKRLQELAQDLRGKRSG